jgi:ABC-type multidrug transport system, ATPase and permease components
MIAVLITLLGNLIVLAQALIINYLIKYLQSSQKNQNEGVFLTILFIFLSLFSCCFKHNGSLKALFLTGKIKNIVALIVSEKVLTLNNTIVSEESTRGKIMNIVSTDMEILELSVYAIYFICSPFIVIVAIIIITTIFGSAGLVGIGISILHAPLVIYLGRRSMHIRLFASKIGDKRVKMIQNLIEGIKIMKLYA